MSSGQDNTGASASNDNSVQETGPAADHDRRLKRIRFRSWHRGIKEMDILMGGFADQHLADLSEDELDAFEVVLTVPDQELYAMLVRDDPHWPDLDKGIMARLTAFCRRES